MASTAASAGVITYRDEGVLDLNKDKLERQRLVDDLFADSGSEPDFEGFPASERVESSHIEDNSALEADAESHDKIQTCVLDDADAAAAYQTYPNLPVFDQAHGPLMHGSDSSAYEIFCSLFPDELLVLLITKTNRYYHQTVDALGGLDNLPPGSRVQTWTPVDLPGIKAFLAILILMGILDWTFQCFKTNSAPGGRLLKIIQCRTVTPL